MRNLYRGKMRLAFHILTHHPETRNHPGRFRKVAADQYGVKPSQIPIVDRARRKQRQMHPDLFKT